MVFDTKLSKSEVVIEMYDRAMKELNSWYGFNWNKNTPKVYMVEDQETFFGLAGKEKKNYVRGFGDYCNNFYVYSPEAQEKFTIHKYREKDYYKFIKHELDHRFIYVYTKGLRSPRWFIEGHAGYIANQIDHSDPVPKFEKFLEWSDSTGVHAYSESGFAVKLLIEKVGKEEFLSFLSGLAEKDFEREFKKVFSMELEYEDFNKLLASS